MRKALDYDCPNPSSSHLHRRLCHQVQGLEAETVKRPANRADRHPTGTPAPPRTAERFVMWSRLGEIQIILPVNQPFWSRFLLSNRNLPRPMVDAHIAASRRMSLPHTFPSFSSFSMWILRCAMLMTSSIWIETL